MVPQGDPACPDGSNLIGRFEKLKKRIVVCLDESDQIVGPDILYVLARSGCSMILISNQKTPLHKADLRIKSSLPLHEIEFKPYLAEEILNILKQRVAYGIRARAIDTTMLSLASRRCGGDARVALQSVKIAAKEAELKGHTGISVEALKYATKCSTKYRLSYLLGKLNEHQRTIYEILKECRTMEFGKLYGEYSRKSNDPVVDRSYRMQIERMTEPGLIRTHRNGRWKAIEIAT